MNKKPEYMQAVWKIDLAKTAFDGGMFEVDFVAGAKILWLAAQDDQPCLWILVDPSKPRYKKKFFWMSTGDKTEVGLGNHVGSVSIANGLIFHLFEL